MKLYHFTKRERVQGIIKNGLIPQINSNSSLCGETVPRAYVCSVQDIKYWAHLLDAEVLLELTPRMPLKMELYSYGRYDELLLYETNLFRVTEIVRPNDVRALFELQQDYVAELSQLALWGCKFIQRAQFDETVLHWIQSVYGVVQGIPRLHYDGMLPTTKLSIIRDYSDDGEYAFTDCFEDTNVPILQYLSSCPKASPISTACDLLYKTIENYFDDCDLVRKVMGADIS